MPKTRYLDRLTGCRPVWDDGHIERDGRLDTLLGRQSPTVTESSQAKDLTGCLQCEMMLAQRQTGKRTERHTVTLRYSLAARQEQTLTLDSQATVCNNLLSEDDKGSPCG